MNTSHLGLQILLIQILMCQHTGIWRDLIKNHSQTGENVDVYILDSGIHYEHEDFNGRALYPGCDPIDKLYHQNQAGRDCEGHGTQVAGLVGGNGTGVANGVILYSVRIIDCGLWASEASLVQGLVCVVKHRENRKKT